jgi:hypothetical protein
MRHRSPVKLDQRGLVLALALALAIGLAACGSAGAAGSPATATPNPATPEPTAVASDRSTPAPTAVPPSPMPSPTEEASPTVFESAAYHYVLTMPATWTATQARQPWDGRSKIDSNGPHTDQVRIPDSILFFVYGAPTDLSVAAYAALGQQQVAEWHGCPATASRISTLTVDGAEGEVHGFECAGLYVQKLFIVRDGNGVVMNMLAPGSRDQEAIDLLGQVAATTRWSP